MKLLIVLALVSASFAQQIDRVKMDVFYEAFCPDTFAYIEELWELYDAFRLNIDVTFYPFGKGNSSTVGTETTFWCQRGADECFGNRVQGCVLSRINNQDAQMSYVACQMSFAANPTHQACAESAGFSWAEIQQCANSPDAIRQQLNLEQVTIPVIRAFNWVPTVAYNGKIIENSHTARAPPLRTVICDYINNANAAC